MNLDEEVREFLIESNENLANLDREIVELEQRPTDIHLISSIFRTIHTIKGTCGFFGFDILGLLAHVAENILGQARERQREMTPEVISIILEAIDGIKAILQRIEETGSEGEDETAELRTRLEAVYESGLRAEVQAATVEVEEAVCEAVAPAVEERVIAFASREETPVEAMPAATERIDDDAAASADVVRDVSLTDSTIRVDVELLNKLMNLVGELVLARNQLMQDTSTERSSLQQTSQRLNLITSELQEGVMKTRMQSVGSVWNKLPRVVRDLASQCGKKVRIVMEGADTELDKSVLEAIKDPLTHVVRNACDHGIETPEARVARGKSPEGLLRLRAYHEGGVVNIEVSDDGAGMDPQRLKDKAVEKGLLRPEQAAQMSAQDAYNLIFLPGFSTAAKVTSISGRGVGMDVVKTNIEKIGGSVSVLNRPEGGTTVRVKIPLTLAIIPGLVVAIEKELTQGGRGKGQERFIIPQVNLLELVRLERPDELLRIQKVHSTYVFNHRGRLLPLIYLEEILGFGRVRGGGGEDAPRDVVNIVVLQAENRQMGLVVDLIHDTQEIVVKPLGRQLKGLTCYLGATIMGDGTPALILDVAGLARQAGIATQVRAAVTAGAGESAEAAGVVEMRKVLLFRSGEHKRLAVELECVNRIERVRARAIEYAGERNVLNYGGSILPLVRLLEAGRASVAEAEGDVQIIVLGDGARRFGLLVDEITDILNEPVTLRRLSTVPGLLGSTLLDGKITELIDVPALAAAAEVRWVETVATSSEESGIDSALTREAA